MSLEEKEIRSVAHILCKLRDAPCLVDEPERGPCTLENCSTMVDTQKMLLDFEQKPKCWFELCNELEELRAFKENMLRNINDDMWLAKQLWKVERVKYNLKD